MKKVLFLLFAFLPVVILAQQVIITDDASYTTPASGAILDVKSVNKGFLPPRVALTGVGDALTIASPAEGLMIYNTAIAGTAPNNVSPGYYYNAGTLAAPSWSRVMNTDLNNGMSFQNDGSPILNGNSTNFTDLVINPATAKNSGGTTPDWANFVPSISTYLFGPTVNEEIAFQVQLPHNYKEGTTIYPHIHWAPMTAAGTSRATWVLDYQWVNFNGNFVESSTSVSGYLVVGDGTTSPTISLASKQHTITELGSGITGTGKTISSILMCRLYRNGVDANDNYTGDAALLSIDFHYEIDTFGSREQFIK